MEFVGGLGLLFFARFLVVGSAGVLVGEAVWSRACRLVQGAASRGLGAGLLVALWQPVAATVLMLAGLGSAAGLGLSAALPVLLGAMLGQGVVAWLLLWAVEFDVSAALLPAMVLAALAMAAHSARWRAAGRLVAGVVLASFALAILTAGLASVAGALPVGWLSNDVMLARLQCLLVGALVGLLLRSQLTMVLVVLAAVVAGELALDRALPALLGLQLLSAASLMSGARGGSLALRQTVWAYGVFSVVAACLGLVLLEPFLLVFQYIGEAGLAGLFCVGFYSVFKLLTVAVFMPLTARFSASLQRHVCQGSPCPTHALDEQLLAVPPLAIAVLQRVLFTVLEAQLNFCLALLRGQPGATAERHQALVQALARADQFMLRIAPGDGGQPLWPQLRYAAQALDVMTALQCQLADGDTAQRWQAKGASLRSGVVLEDGCRQLLKRWDEDLTTLRDEALVLLGRCREETSAARASLMVGVAAGHTGADAAEEDLATLDWQLRAVSGVADGLVKLEQLGAASALLGTGCKTE